MSRASFGAVNRRPGLLAVAHGGTLFRDEVGELLLEAQAMLLRFIQQGKVRPVGSTDTSRVDGRLISASHRDLAAVVERGAFREGLYYRLRRVVLGVPPLRERIEDLPILVEHIRRQVSERYGLGVEDVTREAMRVQAAYHWPGNVRELEGVVEQAMIFQSGGWVRAEDIEFGGERLDRRRLEQVARRMCF